MGTDDKLLKDKPAGEFPHANPGSELFTPITLADRFNRDRAALDELLRVQLDDGFGRQTCRGIPFEFGAADQANVILIDDRAVASLREIYKPPTLSSRIQSKTDHWS